MVNQRGSTAQVRSQGVVSTGKVLGPVNVSQGGAHAGVSEHTAMHTLGTLRESSHRCATGSKPSVVHAPADRQGLYMHWHVQHGQSELIRNHCQHSMVSIHHNSARPQVYHGVRYHRHGLKVGQWSPRGPIAQVQSQGWSVEPPGGTLACT